MGIMFQIIVGLFGGLAIFVFALQMMGSELQAMAGKKMRRVMEVLTSVPIIGVFVGALLTMITQSSSLVTVMVVSFVNASMLTLRQGISVIIGANIGTTLTAQLVALRVTDAWPYLAALGFVLLLVFKRKRAKTIALLAFSMGLMLLGMALMSQAMVPLRTEPAFQTLMVTLSNNRLLALLVGALFTALVQSSTAATGVIVAMALEGLIPFGAALPLILGSNIGTCVTAVLASIGASVSAKRAALAHVLFNLLSALILLIFIGQFESLVLLVSPEGDVARQAANAHTIFSIIGAIIFVPLITPFTKLVTKLVPGEVEQQTQGQIYLDWNMVETPGVAISLAQQELLHMAEVAGENVRLAVEGLLERSEKKLKKVKEQEAIVNELEKEISKYLARMSLSGMDDAMSIRHTGLLHAANDMERVSDHATNIAEIAQTILEEELKFPDEAYQELERMHALVAEVFEAAVQSVREDDPNLVLRVKKLEAEVDEMEESLRLAHIARLKGAGYSIESGVLFLDIISNFERIGDHSNNISDLAVGRL